MSWQAYVDTNLVGSGKVAKAAIVGLQGGVWASSSGYTLSKEEQDALIAAFKPGGFAAVEASGVRLAGQKFFVLTTTPNRSIYAKKQADGAIIVKTTQAILVAEYAHPTQAPETVKVTEDLADYLIGVGY